jgi:pyruvate kinase
VPVQAIVTAPPYAPFLEEVVSHPIVAGLRLNTVMPLKESRAAVLERLQALGKPLWVDLKGRQLRVVGAAIPPYTDLQLSHAIEVETPVDAFFSDGRECVRVVGVEENRLVLEDGPRRLVGPGESVNIVHPSLKINGTLTDTDRRYLAAMAEIGLENVMLSYVECAADIEEVQALLPEAEILLKIENQRGLEFAREYRTRYGRLVAARGDLFVEVLRPHRVVSALREIIAADPQAVVASRLFDSLSSHPVPTSADIGDAAYLYSIGYRTFLLGDAICFRRDEVMAALNLLEAIAAELE